MPLFHKSKSKHGDRNSFEGSNSNSSAENLAYQNSIQRPKFECQLAHGSQSNYISGFKSAEDLYAAIAESFQIPMEEILFCTLNSYRVDMTKLLGNQVAYDDVIYAHVKGTKKEVELVKESDVLGITVTDNGAGYVFVKRVKAEGFIASQQTAGSQPLVEVGDHIERIDGMNFVGKKHLDAAMYLRNIPVGKVFNLRLISPHQSEFDLILSQLVERHAYRNGGGVSYSSGKKTIRLKPHGGGVEEQADSVSGEAVSRINNVIGTHLGIEDEEMARTIFDRVKDCRNPVEVAQGVDEILGSFQFPEASKREIWGIISDFQKGIFPSSNMQDPGGKMRPPPRHMRNAPAPVMIEEHF